MGDPILVWSWEMNDDSCLMKRGSGSGSVKTKESSSSCKSSVEGRSPSLPFEFTNMRKSKDDTRTGFWATVATKAKAILDDDYDYNNHHPSQHVQEFTNHKRSNNDKDKDKDRLRKGFGVIASSITYLGNALEEGLNKVENRTADIIQETRIRRINVRKKAAPDLNRQPVDFGYASQPSGTQVPLAAQTDMGIQLQASRDVAMAMAAKTKLLLRELKTVKSDLAFAKERCAQLEEENRILRDSMEKGDNIEDDELVRLQLETLLAEKARLNQENADYARENRFLREVVEYHQLKMQDVIYLNERNEEITEVYPAKVPEFSNKA